MTTLPTLAELRSSGTAAQPAAHDQHDYDDAFGAGPQRPDDAVPPDAVPPDAVPRFSVGDRVEYGPTDGPYVGRVAGHHPSGDYLLVDEGAESFMYRQPSALRHAPCPPGQPDDDERREIARRLAAGEIVRVKTKDGCRRDLSVRVGFGVVLRDGGCETDFERCEPDEFPNTTLSMRLTIDRDV